MTDEKSLTKKKGAMTALPARENSTFPETPSQLIAPTLAAAGVADGRRTPACPPFSSVPVYNDGIETCISESKRHGAGLKRFCHVTFDVGAVVISVVIKRLDRFNRERRCETNKRWAALNDDDSREKERERERQTDRQTDRERERERDCVTWAGAC